MIKNEHQYRVTRGEIQGFEDALAELSSRPAGSLPDIIRKARADALGSQLEDLRAELGEYEAIREGATAPRRPQSLRDIPRFLIQSRIYRGWTQRDFSERCGLKEQQIQRYEAQDYGQASLDTLCELARVLEVDL